MISPIRNDVSRLWGAITGIRWFAGTEISAIAIMVTQLKRLLLTGFLGGLFLLIASPQSFAQTVPPGLVPVYLGCSHVAYDDINYYPGQWMCYGPPMIFNSPQPYYNQLIGYVFKTQVPGTVPAYLVCTTPGKSYDPDTGQLIQLCPETYNASNVTISNIPNPQSYLNQLIGYVYPTPVAGTVATYLMCSQPNQRWDIDPYGNTFNCGQGASPGTNEYLVAYGNQYPQYWRYRSQWPSFTSFVGYLYQTPPGTTYTGTPNFYIASVIYAPPGQNSSIQYNAGTTTGSTVSLTQSFSASGSATYNVKGGTGSFKISGGITFGGDTKNSVDIAMTQTSTSKFQSPASNTINHDYDQIILMFGVVINQAVDYYHNITDISIDFSKVTTPNGYPVSVGCLRPNSTIPATQCAATLAFLTANNVTPADYPNILAADPFAYPSASQATDPNRFVKLSAYSYFYDPTTLTYTYNITNGITTTNSTTTSVKYTTGVSATFYGLTSANSLTITNSSTHSNKTGSTSADTLTLSMPTSSYIGPSTLNVYQDTIYKTLMFSFY